MNFKEFLEEGKKKRKIEKLTKEFIEDAKRQREASIKNSGIALVDYGTHPPGSPEREAAIRAMMTRQGYKAFK